MPLSRPLRRALPLVLGILVIAAACGPGNTMAVDDATMVNQLRGANAMSQLPRRYELDLKAQAAGKSAGPASSKA